MKFYVCPSCNGKVDARKIDKRVSFDGGGGWAVTYPKIVLCERDGQEMTTKEIEVRR